MIISHKKKEILNLLILMAILIIFYPLDVIAVEPHNATTVVSNPPPIERSEIPKAISLMSHGEFILSLIIVIFGAIVIFIEAWLLIRANAKPDELLKIFAVTLIIIGTLFMITAGYSNNQIAPAVGLFGTIAGYLLGKMSKREGGEHG